MLKHEPKDCGPACWDDYYEVPICHCGAEFLFICKHCGAVEYNPEEPCPERELLDYLAETEHIIESPSVTQNDAWMPGPLGDGIPF